MLTRTFRLCALTASLVLACGPGEIPDSPLTGTFAGSTFTVASATATPLPFGDSPTAYFFFLYEEVRDCEIKAEEPDRTIFFVTEWVEGHEMDLGLSQTVVLVSDGNHLHTIVKRGRLEIVSAPTTPGSTGRMKLRVSVNENSVEGSVDVLVCE